MALSSTCKDGVSCLPQGRQLRIKNYSLLPGGRPIACMCWGAWRKKLSPGLQGSSPLWWGALMCPFDVSALRRLERIIKSSLNSPGWRGWAAAPVGLHTPEVNTFTEVGCWVRMRFPRFRKLSRHRQSFTFWKVLPAELYCLVIEWFATWYKITGSNCN